MNNYDLSNLSLDELFEMMHKAARRGDGDFLKELQEELSRREQISLSMQAEMGE